MFSNLKKKAIVIFLFGFFVILGIFLPFQEKQTDATIGLSFGGKVSYTLYCTCSDNLLLTVTGAKSANVVYQPGASKIYAYGQVYRPGPFIVGLYSEGGVCLMYVAVGCATLPSMGTITIAGTSL